MNTVKSLLLGGAAGFAAVASAGAADLPVKAKPVEYVKVCSLYGEGFFFIPGTDTCIKIGGWVRFDSYFNQNSGGQPPVAGTLGQNSRATNPDFSTRERAVISFDARTQTEYGVLRAYYRGGFELTASLSSQYANGTYRHERAFIQLGGWTFGKYLSFYDIFYAQWSIGAGYLPSGSTTVDFGTNLAAYTAQFGNGVSATLSIEDNNIRRNALWDATAGVAVVGVSPTGDALGFGSANFGPMGPATNGYVACGVSLVGNDNTIANNATTAGLNAVGCGWGDYAAESVPDIVGDVRVEQAWGTAQISGALHQVRANYYGNNFIPAAPSYTGIAPSDAWGFAVGAGISFNLPWNAGDKIWFEGDYAQGAPSYVGWGRNNGYSDSQLRFSGATAMAGDAIDGVFACNGVGTGLATGTLGAKGGPTAATCNQSGIQLSTSWVATAAMEHYWTPALRTSFWGSYAWWGPGAGNTTMCASPLGFVRSAGGAGNPNGAAGANANGAVPLAGCDYSFASWGVGSRTVWNPVKNLDVVLEVEYQKVDPKMDAGLVSYSFGGAGTRPAGLYTPASQDTVTGLIRVQRNFFP
jgi:hypothetical protein